MSKRKREYTLTYHKTLRGWRKVYKGKTLWCGYAKSKSDRAAYRAAQDNFNKIKAAMDSGEYSTDLANTIRKQNAPKKKKQTRRWNPKRVTSCLRKFFQAKQAEVDAGEIGISRLSDLKSRLNGFKEYFGQEDMHRITETDITKFKQHESKRVSKGEIKVSSLGQDYKAVRQFFNWCYKQRIIPERPRNLSDLSVTIRPKKVRFFNKKEIQKLWEGCDRTRLDPKWLKRTGVETDYEILKATILLGLNMGYTQMEVSTLRVEDCSFTTRPARIIKHRHKTGVSMNHLMWKQTRDLLKKHCLGKKPNELVFTRPDGRPLVPYSTNADGKRTGGRSDYLGNKFMRLVERVLGKDDPRRLRQLRTSGANYCKKKWLGLEKLFLGHKDSGMSALYTDPAQKKLDTALCFMEKDFGFTDELQPYYEGRNRKRK